MPTQPPLRAGCPIPSQTAGSSQAPSVPSQRCGSGSASAHPHSAPIPPWRPHPLQPSRPPGVGTPPTPHDPGGLSLSSGRLQPLTTPRGLSPFSGRLHSLTAPKASLPYPHAASTSHPSTAQSGRAPPPAPPRACAAPPRLRRAPGSIKAAVRERSAVSPSRHQCRFAVTSGVPSDSEDGGGGSALPVPGPCVPGVPAEGWAVAAAVRPALPAHDGGGPAGRPRPGHVRRPRAAGGGGDPRGPPR